MSLYTAYLSHAKLWLIQWHGLRSPLVSLGDAFIGTIHSFANQIYRESGNTYRIRSTEVELGLYKEVLKGDGYEGKVKSLTFSRLMEFFDMQQMVEMGQVPEVVMETYLLPSENEGLKEANELLDVMCKERNIINFTELLVYAEEYFKSIGANLEHLMVDEFQDVGKNEHMFIEQLKSKNMFLVGDDWQSLFGFAGGDVNIYHRLIKSPDYKVYYLENNYRNSQSIVDLGNRIIGQVSNRIDKKTKVIRKDTKGKVTIGTKANVDIHLNRIKSEGNYKDWFILVRTNKELYELERKLVEMEIPSTSFKRKGLSLAEMEELVNSDTVKLLTVHVSKGLESKNVLLYGNFKEHVPSYIRNQDERKVMYVGVTRAKDELIVLN